LFGLANATRGFKLLFMPEAGLSIPRIAAHAKVNHTTIYKRWGGLTELLADVAVESLRPEVNPDDTGSLRDDLTACLQKFAEAMSSGPGRAAMRVMLGSSNSESMAAHCCEDTRADLVALVGRAERRDEPAPDADRLLDLIVARVMRTIAASCPSIFREKVTG